VRDAALLTKDRDELRTKMLMDRTEVTELDFIRALEEIGAQGVKMRKRDRFVAWVRKFL
jgi:hypothetical protein